MGYSIKVRNEQGAIYGTVCNSIAECVQWLTDTWADPDALSVIVEDERGNVVASKKRGEPAEAIK